MSGAETDIGQLSQSEQEALQTYIGVTGQDAAEAIPLLQRSQWNVQVSFQLTAFNALNLIEILNSVALDSCFQIF